jgi:hypothetical protein
MNKKILGFDSWTEGYRNYERLVIPLKEAGYDLELIHFGSLGHDIGRPKREKLGQLDVRDVSFYKDSSIQDILNKESPSAVIFLSTESFLHRAVNRYCIKNSIPTLHLYHGLISVQAVESGQPDKYRFMAQLKLVFERSVKNITKILPVYIRSLIETKATISDWNNLISNIIKKVFGRYVSVAAPDASTTMCAVYAKSDVSHAHIKYRVPIERIVVVGNPDLIKFGVKKEDILSCVHCFNKNKKVVYLDHGGSTSGFTFSSENDFAEFLLKTRKATGAAGCQLVVKLHPSQYLTNLPTLLSNQGIDIVDDIMFIDVLKASRAIICGPTSVSIIPAILGLPIILAQYEQFIGQDYGVVLKNYPMSFAVGSINELSAALNDLNACDHDKLQEWISSYIEPLPAADMPKRVVGAIKELTKPRGE